MRATICVIALGVTIACVFPNERPRARPAADRFPAAKPRRQSSMQSQKGDDVDDYIQKSMARQHIPGLSLVVVKDGEIRKIRGYGLASLELNVPGQARNCLRVGVGDQTVCCDGDHDARTGRQDHSR